MKQLTFRNTDKIPLLGLGTWQSEPAQVHAAVIAAIKAGYRHIDCAYIYHNESVIGDALKDAISQGLVRREELFITSKLWNDSHESVYVRPAIERTLKDLKLDYVDLYLMHWPIAFKIGTDMPANLHDFMSLKDIPLEETWATMEKLAEEGLAKHIGVSNFNEKKLQRLFKTAKIKPEMNQIELHPYLQQSDLVKFCSDNSVLTTAYSPLATAEVFGELAAEPAIKELAKKHKCTPAQVIIAWNLNRGVITIPKSVHPARIAENFGASKIALDKRDMDAVAKLNKNLRVNTADIFTPNGSPYTQYSLWED